MYLRQRSIVVLLLVSVLLLQALVVHPSSEVGSAAAETRLPTNYLMVFHDDFQTGRLDPSKWIHWEGYWSTDNMARTPTGGLYPGDDWYITESPYPNDEGDPLDHNGNDGIYYPEEKAMIQTTWVNLANLSTPRLEFEHMYDIPSQGDGALVYVMRESVPRWVLVEPDTPYPEATGWSGQLQTWLNVVIRLDEFAGERIRIGFFFRSTPDTLEGDGWKIDDVEVGGRPEGKLADLRLGNARVYMGGYVVDKVVAGDVLEINMSVMNEGKEHTGPFTVSAYTDHPLVGGEEIGREVILGGIGVGGSIFVSMRWVARTGAYDLLILLDELNQVPEANELNNERRLKLTVDDPPEGDVALLDMHFEAAGTPIIGAAVGDLVTIVARLVNLGTSSVSTPMVVRAYGGVPGPGSEPIGDEQPTFNGLEPGGERPVKIHWRPLAANHTIYLTVGPQDPATVLDFNPDNNVTKASIMVTDHPAVDLVVEELLFIVDGVVTSGASEGANVRILASVNNEGVGTFEGTVEVSVYRGDPDAEGVKVGEQLLIAALGPDEGLQVEFDWRAELGTHAMTVSVDPGNVVYESDEYNNQLGKGLTVSRKPLADLSISSLRMLLNGVELDPVAGTNEGANVEFNITVRNIGNERTKGQTRTDLYLGNPVLEPNLVPVGSFTVPEGLNPDEVYVDSIYWTAERPTQRFKVPVLFALVDAQGTEPEVDEFNNLDVRRLPVGESLPDLTVTALSILDASGRSVDDITYGNTLSLKVKVENIGTDISFQVAIVDFYLDSIDPSNRVGTVATATLAVGDSVERSMQWTPNPGLVGGGDHQVIAHVDPENEIEESSDANNQLGAGLHIDSEAKPNLLVLNIEVLKGGGRRLVERLDEGERAQVRVVVANLGSAPLSRPSSVELYHGDPVDPDEASELVQVWQLDALAVGKWWNGTVEWTFKRDLPLYVYIDRSNSVPETRENDNVKKHDVTVVPPPEGPNYLGIGGVVGLAVLLFLALTFIVARRPLKPREEEFVEGEPQVIAPDVPVGAEAGVELPPGGPTDEETVEEAGGEADVEPGEMAKVPAGKEAESEVETDEEAEGVPVEPTPGEERVARPKKVPRVVKKPTAPGPQVATGKGAEAEIDLDTEGGAEPRVVAEGEPPSEEAAPAPVCPSCGEQVDPEWILCPFCDTALE